MDNPIAQDEPTLVTAPSRDAKIRAILISIAAVAGSIGIAVAVFYFRHEVRRLGMLGYPGVFIINLLSSATLFVPAPGFLAVFALGSVLNPLLVGIIAGAGSALGEITGYLAGIGGRAVIEDKPLYNRFHYWISRYGMLAIIVMAAVPNPLFDLGGLIAGVTGMPLWRFVLATWIGKSARFIFLALGGSHLLPTG
ncbi:MAG: VTT domain-containing protein [Chloroflexi bacterium]|nr:VTT domain-containing protein [Chloroflexota bacterium]